MKIYRLNKNNMMWNIKISNIHHSLNFVLCGLSYLFSFGCAGSSLLHGLFSSCRGGGGPLCGCGAQASHCSGFSRCRAWPLGSVGFRLYSTGSIIVVHGLTGSLTVRSSQIRDQTRVSWIGWWILYHRATREALDGLSYIHTITLIENNTLRTRIFSWLTFIPSEHQSPILSRLYIG